MTDDNDPPGRIDDVDLAAWEPPPPPGGLADAVIERMREPIRASAHELGERPPVQRRWWIVGSAAAAAVACAALVQWGVSRAPRVRQGDVVADRPKHLELAPSAADLDPGAEVRWSREGDRVSIAQARGAVAWRAGGSDTLVIDAGAAVASVEATGASLRVEVQMNATDARVIGASSATAVVAALVTVVVYEGRVKVTGSGETLEVSPGDTVEIRTGEAPRHVLVVGGGADEMRAQIRALQKRVDEALGTVTVKDRPPGPDGVAFMERMTEALDPVKPEILACRDGTFAGTVETEVRVEPSGKLAGLEFTPRDAPVVSCMQATLEKVELPATKAGGAIKMSYQFTADDPAFATRDFVSAATRVVWAVTDEAGRCGNGTYTTKLEARLDIRPDGHVDRVDLVPGDAPVAACVIAELRKARFPATKIGGRLVAQVGFKPPCNASDLQSRGTDSYAGGDYGEALRLFEEGYACRPDTTLAQRAFMAACKTTNRARARHWYQVAPTEADRAVTLCVLKGITKDELVRSDEPPRPPPSRAPTTRTVPPTELEALRISGRKEIEPDGPAKRQLEATGKNRIIASFKLCVDANGVVGQVVRLKGSGSARYDEQLEAGIRAWRYRPHRLGGTALPACTAVTFIYQAGCDTADFMSKGTDAYASGRYAEALTRFEQAFACKRDRFVAQRAFMAACKLANRPKARFYYRFAPQEAEKAHSICVGVGITKDELE